jgi:hypothetical protein
MNESQPPLEVARALLWSANGASEEREEGAEESTAEPQVEPWPLTVLTQEHRDLLESHGYFVLPSSPDIAKVAIQARECTSDLAFKLPQNMADDETKGEFDFSARSDWIVWLHQNEPPLVSGNPMHDLVSTLEVLINDIGRIVQLRCIPDPSQFKVDWSQVELQLGKYSGKGARYERHRDGFPEGPEGTQRRVTLICYLDDRTLEDGGSLRLFIPKTGDAYKDLDSEDEESKEELHAYRADEKFVDINPQAGKMVCNVCLQWPPPTGIDS